MFNVKRLFITLKKIQLQRNTFSNLLNCKNNFSRPITNRILRYNKVVIGLGIIGLPFVQKVAAESEPTKPEKITDANNTIQDKPKEVEKTGWERLCAMYEFDEYGNLSKELNATFQATCIACVVGLLYGGVTSSRIALIDFMERNQASIFENHIDAKRRLQNHVTIHFGKGAFRWASRLSIFTGGFMLFLMSMSAYRGGFYVMDYGISGAAVGSILRFRLGPPAMAVGGVLGGVLGVFCGLTTTGLLSLAGSSFDEVLSFQYEIEKKRNDLFKEGLKKSNEALASKEVVDLLKEREKNKGQGPLV